MTLLLLLLGLLAALVLELRWLVSLEQREIHDIQARVAAPERARLREALGVAVDGVVTGPCEMHGRRAGRDFHVHQRTRRAPPWGGDAEEVTCIEVAAALGDLVVVPGAEVDRALASRGAGPRLTVARTGVASFDEACALLVPADAPEGDAPFREAAAQAPPWASAAVLESFVAARPRWMQAANGTLTLCIAAGEPGPLIEAVGMALTVAGVPVDGEREPPPEPVVSREKARGRIFGDLWVASAVAFTVGMPVFLIVDCTAPFSAVTEAVDCGPGEHMHVRSYSNGRGKSGFSVECYGDRDRHLIAHWVVTVLLYFTLILAVMIVRKYWARYLRSIEDLPT